MLQERHFGRSYSHSRDLRHRLNAAVFKNGMNPFVLFA